MVTPPSRPRSRASALTLAAALAIGGLAAPAPATADDGLPRSFDFGTPSSPVADGMTQVTEQTTYSTELGYGIVDPTGAISRDRGESVGDLMQRDFVARFDNPWQFVVDVPTGHYDVTFVIAETSGARATSQVAVEGIDGGRHSVTGDVLTQTVSGVEVTDGQLTVDISGTTGHLNGLTITQGQAPEPEPDPDPEPDPEPEPDPDIPPGDPIDISPEQPLRLDFGTGAVADGYTQVTSQSGYTPEAGYGFAAASLTDVAHDSDDALRGDAVAIASGTFVVNLPNRDFRIALVAGDETQASEIGIAAESQQKVQLTSKPTGEFLEMGFDIALVDGQLTLEFSGSAAHLNALVITPLAERQAADQPTLFLTGDSTVQTYDPYWVPQAGWGQMLPRYFPEGVDIENHSIGGRSSKTFITESRLDEVLRQIRPGDYLFAQFGHNDATISRPERYASPEDYKEYLRTFVEGSRQRGATPILVTPVSRMDYSAEFQKFNVSFPEYVAAMQELAAELDVLVVDLSASSRAYLDEIGYEAAHSVFLHAPAGVYPNRPDGVQDNTHFQEYGAIQMARLVAEDVADLGLDISELVVVATPDAVPGTPTGLVAGTVTNASVVLEWDAVDGADIYRVYRADGDSGDFVLAGTSTIPYAQIGGLAEGQSYRFAVSAVNAKGEGTRGEPIQVTTREASLRYDFGPTGAPVEEGFTEVTRADVYTEEAGYGIADPTGMIDRDRGDAAGNLMQRDFVAYFGNVYEFKSDVPNGTYAAKITVGDLLGTVRSNFQVEGVDVGGMSISRNHTSKVFDDIVVTDGQFNLQVSGATGHLNGLELTSVLLAPVDVVLDDLAFEGATAQASLSWGASPDAASYRVYRNSGTGPQLLGSTETLAFVDDGARTGMTYEYTVTAVTAAGTESVASQPLEVTMVDPDVEVTDAPIGLEVTDTQKNSVSLAWQPVDGALFYTVYRWDAQHPEPQVIGYSDEAQYTNGDVLTTISYSYRVTATNAGGESEPSETVVSEAVTTLSRQAERLDRSPVAVQVEGGVYVGWRMLGDDPDSIKFHVFRDGKRVTEEAIEGATNFLDADGSSESEYRIARLGKGGQFWATDTFGVWSDNHLDIPLVKPADGVTKDGQPYTYHANDASVGDVDGDGQYEVVVMWNPSNARDNSQSGYTGNVYLDAYETDGTQLWRIDLGRNIRAGAHYSMPMLYDLDGDSRAELVVKTADGTIDGTGVVIGDPDADWRNSGGYVLSGPEFLTVFDGATGAAVDTIDYTPPRGDVGSWGDGYGNRVDRFLAGVAYLDGEKPSVVFTRGYYTRSVLAAYDFDGSELTERWVFDTATPGLSDWAGQGNHNLSVADVDRDGKDEIVFGSMTIDDDGTGLYNTGLGHGDAMHLTDHIPDRDGLEVFAVHESMGDSGNRAATMRDAATGEIIWASSGDRDTGRGAAADIDPRHAGNEAWHIGGTYAWDSKEGHLFTAHGDLIGTSIPAANFVTWWDGDLLREVTDHRYDAERGSGAPVVFKWDWEAGEQVPVFEPDGVRTNNSTKGTPALQADLFGDWREELVFRTDDSSALRVFTTTDITEYRLRTLMHDPVYRLGVAWQNVSYNQPPHTSFFLGEGMTEPAAPHLVFTSEAPDPEPARPRTGPPAAKCELNPEIPACRG